MHVLLCCACCVLLQVRVAEQEGIVFIDEIDKIVNPSGAIRHGEPRPTLCVLPRCSEVQSQQWVCLCVVA